MIPGEGDERSDGGGSDGQDDGRGRDRDQNPDAGSPKERFADLVGPLKPLRPGPTRRPPTAAAGPEPGPGPSGNSEAPPPSFRWPDPEERCLAAASGVSDQQLLHLGRGEPAPGERIDLHGVRHDAAESLLGRRLEAARARGLRSVLVIHGIGRHSGSGEAVLREALPDWLTGRAGRPHVLAFAPAPPRLGDRGATIVLLRRPRR
jgi:DNA-nicking Smr family endonuclease